MAKQSGLGWTTLSVDNVSGTPVDIRSDCTGLDFDTPYAMQDVTGIDKSAHERLALLADFTMSLSGVFNPSLSHPVFASDLTVHRTATIVVGGKTLTNECLMSAYTLTRADDGKFTWKVPFTLQDGTVPAWS